jgi:hypothetical protein
MGTPLESPEAVTRLGTFSFDPWDAWPSASPVGPTFDVQNAEGDNFALASALTPNGDFAAAVHHSGIEMPPVLLWAPELLANKDSDALVSGVQFASTDDHIRFLSEVGFVGIEHTNFFGDKIDSYGLDWYLGVNIPGAGQAISEIGPLACAKSPMVAGAARSGAGDVVFAFSTGAQFGKACEFVDPGPPNEIAVTVVPNNKGPQPNPAYSVIEAGSSVARLDVAGKSTGGFVGWVADGDTVNLFVQEFDEASALVGSPLAISGTDYAHNVTMGVATFADWLVLAVAEPFDGGADFTDNLRVKVLQPNGAVVSAALPTNGAIHDPIAVLSAPAPRASFLVAWSEWGPNAEQPTRVRMARFDCAEYLGD